MAAQEPKGVGGGNPTFTKSTDVSCPLPPRAGLLRVSVPNYCAGVVANIIK